jgi:hypothetical protein
LGRQELSGLSQNKKHGPKGAAKGEALHSPVEKGVQPRLAASNCVSGLNPRVEMVENLRFYSVWRCPKEIYD